MREKKREKESVCVWGREEGTIEVDPEVIGGVRERSVSGKHDREV